MGKASGQKISKETLLLQQEDMRLQEGSDGEHREDRWIQDYCRNICEKEKLLKPSGRWASGFQFKLLFLSTCISSTSAAGTQFISDGFRTLIVARKKPQQTP